MPKYIIRYTKRLYITSSSFQYLFSVSFIEEPDLHDFAVDNTITATCNPLTEHLKILEQESELVVVSWFKQDKRIQL